MWNYLISGAKRLSGMNSTMHDDGQYMTVSYVAAVYRTKGNCSNRTEDRNRSLTEAAGTAFFNLIPEWSCPLGLPLAETTMQRIYVVHLSSYEVVIDGHFHRHRLAGRVLVVIRSSAYLVQQHRQKSRCVVVAMA